MKALQLQIQLKKKVQKNICPYLSNPFQLLVGKEQRFSHLNFIQPLVALMLKEKMK